MKKMKKQKNKPTPAIEEKNIQKILLGTIAFLTLVYIITAIITGEINLKKDKKEDEPTETSIQYSEILAGETFNRPESEYYVIFYKFDNKDAVTVQTILDNYAQKENAIKIYRVDLTNSFNQSIYTDGIAVLNVNNVSNLKVKDYSLIKVKSGKNISHLEGKSAIINNFTK
jgi:hypothetical protein